MLVFLFVLFLQVNASECRSGVLIKHKFKEAMESHGLSNWFDSLLGDFDRACDRILFLAFG
jgi:hypothetical protein